MLIKPETAQSIVAQTPPSAARLDARAVLRVSGDDRRTFLQGLVSNDVTKAEPEHCVYACFLTPQGKFLHEMLIFADDAALYLDTEGQERAADLQKRLNMYRLRSDVVIENTDMTAIALYGAGVADINVPGNAVIAAPDPRAAALGLRILCPAGQVDALFAGLSAQGVTVGDAADYDCYRLRLAIPDGSRDMQIERATLMESGIDSLNGISWDKGCYMGQELTSRMKYRNLGKRRLVLFRLQSGDGHVSPGAPIMAGDKMVGETRSAAGGYVFGLVRVADILDARQLPEKCHTGNVELIPVSIASPENQTPENQTSK